MTLFVAECSRRSEAPETDERSLAPWVSHGNHIASRDNKAVTIRTMSIRTHILLLVLAPLVLVALLVVFALTNSLVQLAVPNELRGRVLSIYMMAFRGGMPLGSLISGYFITLSSEQVVITVNGLLLSTVACYFLIRSHGVREL